MTTDIASGGTSNFLATKKYFRANHTTANFSTNMEQIKYMK